MALARGGAVVPGEVEAALPRISGPQARRAATSWPQDRLLCIHLTAASGHHPATEEAHGPAARTSAPLKFSHTRRLPPGHHGDHTGAPPVPVIAGPGGRSSGRAGAQTPKGPSAAPAHVLRPGSRGDSTAGRTSRARPRGKWVSRTAAPSAPTRTVAAHVRIPQFHCAMLSLTNAWRLRRRWNRLAVPPAPRAPAWIGRSPLHHKVDFLRISHTARGTRRRARLMVESGTR